MGTVMGIAGSARRNGNSATLMRAVLRGASAAGADTEEVYLNGLTYQGCQGCERCSPDGACILHDELTPVLARLRQAPGWVLASPIYYDGVTGPLKTFFDRLRTFTKDPVSGALTPQLTGPRGAVVLVTYEDRPREDYWRQAEVLARYLRWMGDFAVEIMAEGNLGPRDAARGRPDLLARAEALGREVFGPVAGGGE